MNTHLKPDSKPDAKPDPIADQQVNRVSDTDHTKQTSSLEVPLASVSPVNSNLLKSFTLLSLLTIFFISSISAFLLSGFVTERMLQEEALVTQQFIQSAARTDELPDRPYQQDFLNNKRWLAGYLQRIGRLPDTPLIKIYAPDQSIIWATDSSLIGLTFKDNEELIATLKGLLIYKQEEVHELDSVNDKTDLSYFSDTLDRVVELYIPIWNADHDQVIAVVELYKTPEYLFNTLFEIKLYIWIGAFFGGALLFVVLFSIVRHASNTLRKQQQAIIETEALATIGEMTSALAHGIRNPLASIRSSAELALMAPENCCQMAKNTIVSVDRLQAWIKEFIQFTETEKQFISQVVVFDNLVKESIELIAEAAKSQNIVIQLLPFETHAPVIGDPALLRQLIAIILDNALEAMPEGGILTLKQTRHDDFHLRLEISDNGVGIPEDHINSVFKPFISNKKHALGLGLMMAQRIAHHHNGHVQLSSKEGKGTSVSIILPMLTGRTYKVQVIDNETTFSQNLKSYLEQFEFEVMIAETGNEGLEASKAWQPDIVLMETKLPDMDGIKLCREISKRSSKTHIIALTGQTDSSSNQPENSAANLQQAGVRKILTKPLPLADIRTELERAKGISN